MQVLRTALSPSPSFSLSLPLSFSVRHRGPFVSFSRHFRIRPLRECSPLEERPRNDSLPLLHTRELSRVCVSTANKGWPPWKKISLLHVETVARLIFGSPLLFFLFPFTFFPLAHTSLIRAVPSAGHQQHQLCIVTLRLKYTVHMKSALVWKTRPVNKTICFYSRITCPFFALSLSHTHTHTHGLLPPRKWLKYSCPIATSVQDNNLTADRRILFIFIIQPQFEMPSALHN